MRVFCIAAWGAWLAVAGCGRSEAASHGTPEVVKRVVEAVADAAADAVPPRRARETVLLVTLKSFPEELMVEAERALEREYGFAVERGPVVELPKAAYYAPRRRYRAEKLLGFLERFHKGRRRTRVLGLTEVDISTTKGEHKDWGILGYGELPGNVAVISSFRLKRKAKSRAQIKARMRKLTLHEIGHTLGLAHCKEDGCFMRDAEGSVTSLDHEGEQLKAGCAAKLR